MRVNLRGVVGVSIVLLASQRWRRRRRSALIDAVKNRDAAAVQRC